MIERCALSPHVQMHRAGEELAAQRELAEIALVLAHISQERSTILLGSAYHACPEQTHAK